MSGLTLNYSCHTRNICKACLLHVRALKPLRRYLTCEADLFAANVLTTVILSLEVSLFLTFAGSKYVQNSLARIVASIHISPM